MIEILRVLYARIVVAAKEAARLALVAAGLRSGRLLSFAVSVVELKSKVMRHPRQIANVSDHLWSLRPLPRPILIWSYQLWPQSLA